MTSPRRVVRSEPTTRLLPPRAGAPRALIEGRLSGDNGAVWFDDWLPSLDRAASWTDEEKLLQLAGHLRGRTLQKRNLIPSEDRSGFANAVKSLCSRIDLENRVLAGQDFRHAMQESSESVTNYICRLERLFQIAYGHDGLRVETRDTLLYSQLQEGLRYNLIKSPAVSGADLYKQLCIAAKYEEKRLGELVRRQQYLKDGSKKGETKMQPQLSMSTKPCEKYGEIHHCYSCGSMDHLAQECRNPKTESSGRSKDPARSLKPGQGGSHREITHWISFTPTPMRNSVTSRQSEFKTRAASPERSQHATAATGIIDSGADITIMGTDLFKRVARLRKRSFKRPDKILYTYDHQPFSLDGMDITFDNHTMHTPVYVKMDACDPLLGCVSPTGHHPLPSECWC